MKKKILVAGLVVLAVGIIGYMLYSKQSADVSVEDSTGHIMSTTRKIPVQDVKMFLKGFPAQSANEDPRKYFSREIVNAYTVRFFKFIQTSIAFTSMEEHLKAVKAYLQSILDPGKAEEMFALYKKFIDYETTLTEKAKSWGEPKTADEFLRYLQSIQDYRREMFGKEVADAMWGAEVKAHEYTIRKNSIKADANLYGADKEKRINNLKEEMWGADAALMEDPPQSDPERYEKYQEKQVLYQRDLQESSAYERMKKIKEFRENYFSSDQVAKLEQVDKEMEGERQREADYQAQEKAIMNDPGMGDEKKAEAIRELQNSTFGEDADAFRRRLNIQKNAKK
jgi:lipase chaperone LimK